MGPRTYPKTCHRASSFTIFDSGKRGRMGFGIASLTVRPAQLGGSAAGHGDALDRKGPR